MIKTKLQLQHTPGGLDPEEAKNILCQKHMWNLVHEDFHELVIWLIYFLFIFLMHCIR